MTTIFEALRADHDRQRSLIEALVETEGASDEREVHFADLTVELAAHAKMEERCFYVVLMESDLTQERARHSVAEHKELDDFVEALASYDRSSPQWLLTARALETRLRHHLDEEEHEVFQLAGKVLSEAAKDGLARSYMQGMREARLASGASVTSR